MLVSSDSPSQWVTATRIKNAFCTCADIEFSACVHHINKSAKCVQKVQTSFHSFRKHLDTISPHLRTIKNQTPKRLAAYMLPNLVYTLI